MLLKREVRTLQLYVALNILVLLVFAANAVLMFFIDMQPLIIIFVIGIVVFGVILKQALRGLKEAKALSAEAESIFSDFRSPR